MRNRGDLRELTEHVGARHRETTDSRTAQEIEDFCGGERDGSYNRNLITPVPRDREGTFTTEVFEGKKIASGRFL